MRTHCIDQDSRILGFPGKHGHQGHRERLPADIFFPVCDTSLQHYPALAYDAELLLLSFMKWMFGTLDINLQIWLCSFAFLDFSDQLCSCHLVTIIANLISMCWILVSIFLTPVCHLIQTNFDLYLMIQFVGVFLILILCCIYWLIDFYDSPCQHMKGSITGKTKRQGKGNPKYGTNLCNKLRPRDQGV